MKTPQIVIDTNVLIAAQRSQRGASSKLMSLLGTNRFDAHVSVPLVLEYEEVLLRQRLLLGLTQPDVADLIDAICALTHIIESIFSGAPTCAMQRMRWYWSLRLRLVVNISSPTIGATSPVRKSLASVC